MDDSELDKTDATQRVGLRQISGIDDHVEQALGDALRKAFSFITDEPVPERFLQIVEELARDKKG